MGKKSGACPTDGPHLPCQLGILVQKEADSRFGDDFSLSALPNETQDVYRNVAQDDITDEEGRLLATQPQVARRPKAPSSDGDSESDVVYLDQGGLQDTEAQHQHDRRNDPDDDTPLAGPRTGMIHTQSATILGLHNVRVMGTIAYTC